MGQGPAGGSRWWNVTGQSDELIASILEAVASRPDDLALRLHAADLLSQSGRAEEAVQQAAVVLQRDPSNAVALDLIRRAGGPGAPASSVVEQGEPPAPSPRSNAGFDWGAAEAEVEGLVPPMYVGEGTGETEDVLDAYDVERPTMGLADVGGMAEVKARLDAAFLTPMRHPELSAAFAKSLKGGLLLYGPPGCGKTFLARALAGELGAAFVNVAFSDVLDMYLGQSERNLHETFQTARRHAPCVLFLDEVDAIGQKRSLLRHSALRGTVNQLLVELDDVIGANEGIFVLAATNAPWDVDPALRRPGRLDRTLLVLSPDAAARDAILRYHLRDRPIAGIDIGQIVHETDGYSGADLAHICEVAAERALMASVNLGRVRLIAMDDILGALKEVRPSTGPWFDIARNVAQFSNEGGSYDDLLRYLKQRRML